MNKVLETLLRDNVMQLLQISWMHIDDANLLFHNILMVLYWIDIWWLWRSFEYSHCHVQEARLR